MYRIKILLILFLLTCFCLSLVAGPSLDLVVMVDTSNSMEIYFDDLLRYILTDILKKNLRPNDTFHLIRFSEHPVHELTQVISDEESTDAIIKKISFLKGKLLFGRYTDILSALKYLILYAEGLPKRNNKKLLFLSDFIHSPSKESTYAGISREELENELATYARTIRERDGWSIHFIRFPSIKGSKEDRQEDMVEVAIDPNYRDWTSEDDTTGPLSDSSSDISKDDTTGPLSDSPSDISEDDTTGPLSDSSSDISEDDTTGPLSDSSLHPSDDTSDDSVKKDMDDEENDVVDIVSNTFGVDIPTFDENGKEDPSNVNSVFPRLEFPGDLGRKGSVFNVPFIIHNYSNDDIIIKLKTLEYQGKNILFEPVQPKFAGPGKKREFKVKIKLPVDTEKGPCKFPVTLTFDDDHRIAPRNGILTFYYTGDEWISFFNAIGENFTVIIFILIVIIVILIIFIFIRMRVFEGVFSDIMTTPDWRSAGATPLEGDNLIEMRVSFQNPHIGYRNIHKIDNDKSLSVGGGFSAFMIFLIPMPSHIAEIQNIEGTYIFNPIKYEFFPDLKGPVENCLNKDIPVVSEHGYRSMITFKLYESPLSRINKLLHSAQHEG